MRSAWRKSPRVCGRRIWRHNTRAIRRGPDPRPLRAFERPQARCCSTRSAHLTATTCRSPRAVSASPTATRKTPRTPRVRLTPGIRGTTTGPLRPGPRQCGPAWRFAEKAPRRTLQPRTTRSRSTARSCSSARTVMSDGGVSPRSLLARRHARPLPSYVVFYDDNASSIRTVTFAALGSATTRRSASEAYGYGRDPRRRPATHAERAWIARRCARQRPAIDRPLVCCRTVIGRVAPNKAGTHDVHGAPLGAQELAGARASLGWPPPAVEDYRPGSRRHGNGRPRGAALRGGLAEALRRLRRRSPRACRRVPAFTSRATARAVGRHGGCALRQGAPATTARRARHRRTCCDDLVAADSRAVRTGSADLTWSKPHLRQGARSRSTAGRRQLRTLRRARVRHGADYERHGAATAGSCPTAAPSSSSPITCATRSA